MNKTVSVAIIDSGINVKNMDICSSVNSGLGISYDNGRLVYQRNYEDRNGHGTYCAEIIRRFCPLVKFTIIKILNDQKEGNSKCLIEALNYLTENPVDVVNLSLATANIECEKELRLACSRLNILGTVIVSSLANHSCSSYPAIFNSVFGVKGEIYLNENEFQYHPNNTIQCKGSGVPVLVEELDGTYTFFGGNSKAAANITGILSGLLCNNDGIEPERLLMLHSMDTDIELSLKANLEDIINKDFLLKNELLEAEHFKRLIRLAEDYLEIPAEKRKLLLKYSLLNPVFHINKKRLGTLIQAIEQEWKIRFQKERVTLLCCSSIESLYWLLKRTLDNESN